MKSQRLAWSLAQHTSTPSSLFSTASSRAARHRAWLTASSLRPARRNLSTSYARQAPESAASETEKPAPPVASFIRRTPTQPGTTDEPFDAANSNPDPIIPPPAPTADSFPKWGAPVNLRRRQISSHNAQIASLMGSTGRAAGRGQAKNLDPNSTALYESLRQPPSPRARDQNAVATIIDREMQMGIHERVEAPPPVRVDAFMGRAAVVNRTTQPLGRALTSLNLALRQNQIKDQVRSQKFYERPGLRRKRLRSQRWRKRFMVGFKDMVNKVREMRAQGW